MPPARANSFTTSVPIRNSSEWERNRDGTETSYVRDDDDRITAKIVKAPGRAEVETHYAYGPFGQLESETVVLP